ncbi:MAG: hypothetical protein ACK5V3_02310, partial [Bdellovibrionales bacterium]
RNDSYFYFTLTLSSSSRPLSISHLTRAPLRLFDEPCPAATIIIHIITLTHTTTLMNRMTLTKPLVWGLF